MTIEHGTHRKLMQLAIADPNAARLMAYLYSLDTESETDQRMTWLCAALGITREEFDRCLEALEAAGLGKVKWMH